VRAALDGLGLDFEQEYKFGRWSIDFALPSQRIAIEVDGDYWHKRTVERDARRDGHLTAAGWRVVRLPELAIQEAIDVSALVYARIQATT
jgi:very-short-patch-repair endonuclease